MILFQSHVLSRQSADTELFPSVGDPPYDRVTIFGKAQFDNTVFSCEAVEGGQSCSQSGDVTAPIDRTIAKR